MVFKSILFIAIPCLLFSCTNGQGESGQKSETRHYIDLDTVQHTDPNTAFTQQQEEAFDALNSIQLQGRNMYSTFAGLDHECYPPDTSFMISQDQLLVAMKALLSRHFKNVTPDIRDRLAAKAVLAQEEYLVYRCKGYFEESTGDAITKAPTLGSWILPKVLNQRDIIMIW